ncbi:malate dehydrogenase (oxaloacetate-decarboxylating)(NADP+) [Plasticicumulans lactativorans]|uniref:NADP-dependent malic enzyme n=1 Tax=Plasticicumulans lactativorans TaxID=1133106 RepID=A0A4V2SCY9_9GAMM|nr:NADP-dependent malic enzyme [Plasticicumulans lactativorans]TCO81130.1 malate dehydrogenase (oxaloacetate-decarboxylating)(NADP+) [Plasticicumulans lactativorans]
MSDDLKSMALHYHRTPVPGKIEVAPTKPLATQRDLALAYSPGVAYACEAIVEDPNEAATVTARGNLVAVITNGTAVLGLGAIGPLAAKPVMEGKGVLFKKFAGINVFDIEIDERDPDALIDTIARLEPTFGGINLEDIKAPECFYIEEQLRSRMKIPVFHDDQHGTAIVVGSAVFNALRLVGKDMQKVKLVCSGAGAAALACLELLVSLGIPRGNIWVSDIEGVVYQGRTTLMDERKARFAQETSARKLAEIVAGADIFLGLSAPGVLSGEMVATMAAQPLIFALANPTPEILPEIAKAARPDAIIATGRSDYPNQVNNVLVFPYIFRGALDVGATTINEEMKLACVRAIADLATQQPTEEVMAVYAGQDLSFGPEYLIPKPFDPRLIIDLPIAVARAAMDSGVAARPIADFAAYREELSRYVYRSGMVMKPVFDRARTEPKRVVFSDAEDDRVLRAVQVVVADGLARPILLGRRERVEARIRALELNLVLGENVELIDVRDHPYFDECLREYHRLLCRQGMTLDNARMRVRTRNTVLGALLVRLDHADAMICGTVGRYRRNLEHVLDVIGLRPGVKNAAAMNMLLTPKGPLFLCDTHVNYDPSSEDIAHMTVMAAEAVRRFGITPKVALLSHSNFGSDDSPTARKMATALQLVHDLAPGLEVEGEMQGDTALSEVLRSRLFPDSQLSGSANLLILPNLDAANIAYNLIKMVSDAVAVGPMLLGVNQPVHVLTNASTVRRIVNMSAIAAVDAQLLEVVQGA